MIALFLTLSLASIEPAYKCKMDDAACWRIAALAQEERAERAEFKLRLETSAREVAERMTVEEIKRGDRWMATAMAVAPKAPAFYETPTFWGGIGVVVGVAATVAVVYAVSPALR